MLQIKRNLKMFLYSLIFIFLPFRVPISLLVLLSPPSCPSPPPLLLSSFSSPPSLPSFLFFSSSFLSFFKKKIDEKALNRELGKNPCTSK